MVALFFMVISELQNPFCVSRTPRWCHHELCSLRVFRPFLHTFNWNVITSLSASLSSLHLLPCLPSNSFYAPYSQIGNYFFFYYFYIHIKYSQIITTICWVDVCCLCVCGFRVDYFVLDIQPEPHPWKRLILLSAVVVTCSSLSRGGT